jgi:protein ImuB
VVHHEPIAVEVRDHRGEVVRVDGRGAVSAAPTTVAVSGSVERVVAWAGPWPVDERWWDAHRARRIARFQMLTRSGRLLLLAVERGAWWLHADYR